VSILKLPKRGGPGPRIYIPQEQGGPLTSPDIGFRLRAGGDVSSPHRACGTCSLHLPIVRMGIKWQGHSAHNCHPIKYRTFRIRGATMQPPMQDI
jgi:hypothetical protein